MLSFLTAFSLSKNTRIYPQCDEEIDAINRVVTKTLEKGKTYCVAGKFIMKSNKPVIVNEFHYGNDPYTTYISPFFVNALDSELKCNYCEVTLISFGRQSMQGNPNFVALNHDNLTFEFDWPATGMASTDLAIVNPKPCKVSYKFTKNGIGVNNVYEASKYLYRLGSTRDHGFVVSVAATIAPSDDYIKLDQFGEAKFIGRVPATGRAYKAQDLINEFLYPGTVSPQNSTQGPGYDDEENVPDISNGPKPNDEEKKKFRETTGYKCDDFIVPGPLEVLFLNKSKSYCSNKPYYIVADKPFQIREKHYIAGSEFKISASKTYQSPFYVGSEYSEIICDDCLIHYGGVYPSNINFFAMKQTDRTFTFALPSNQLSFSVTSYNHRRSIKYSTDHNNFNEFSKYENNIYTQDLDQNKRGKQIDIQIKEDEKAFQRRLQEVSFPDFPAFMGRVPMSGNIFSVEDLENEFMYPGTVSQHNSKLGRGKNDTLGKGETSSIKDIIQVLNDKYKTQCDDVIVFDEITKIITLPQSKSYCLMAPAFFGSKQKFEALVIETPLDYKTMETKIGDSMTLINPEYIGSYFSKLTCVDSVDCKVQVYFPSIAVGERSSSYIVVSKTDAEIPIVLENSLYHNAAFNYLSQRISNMKITHNGETIYEKAGQTFGRHFFQLVDGKLSNYTVSLSTKATFSTEDDNDENWILPEIIGRIPTSGSAFVAKDLEKEYTEPGSVNQGNSQVEVKKQPTPPPKKGLGGGAIAAIVIVVLLVVAAACAAVYFFVFRKRSEAPSEDLNKE